MKKVTLSFILLVAAVIIFTGCTNNDVSNNQSASLVDQTPEVQKPPAQFSGNEGEQLSLTGDGVQIETKSVSDGQAHFFNTTLSNGNKIYYFIVQDKDGILRAAANACQVCYSSKMGFVQEGNSMKCKTCGNKYPLEKIATEKGGCNPGPINPNLKDEGGLITITEEELEEVADLFI